MNMDDKELEMLKAKRLAENKFRKVNFFKPDSSKSHSKESYIICKKLIYTAPQK